MEEQEERLKSPLTQYSSSNPISTDELLILSGVLNYVPQNSAYFATEKEDAENPSNHNQSARTSDMNTTFPPDEFVSSSGVEKHGSGDTGSDAYQGTMMSQIPKEHANELGLGNIENQGERGNPGDASAISSHYLGLGYGQNPTSQFDGNASPGMVNDLTGQTLAGPPMDTFGSANTDTNPPIYRLPELSAAELDSIMSYPVSWAPSMDPLGGSWPSAGASTSTTGGPSGEGDMDWNMILDMAGMTDGSDDWTRMVTDWNSRLGNAGFI